MTTNIYAIRQNCFKRVIEINNKMEQLQKEKAEQKDKIKDLNRLLLKNGYKI